MARLVILTDAALAALREQTGNGGAAVFISESAVAAARKAGVTELDLHAAAGTYGFAGGHPDLKLTAELVDGPGHFFLDRIIENTRDHTG